jgi:hypothetical protein
MASALDIPNILLSDNQPDFSGYYNPLTRASLYIFRAYRLNYLTSQKLIQLSRIIPAYFSAIFIADECLVL